MAKIFTLSEASSIAIHSMVLILNSKERLNANHIAEKLGASRHHVSKVLQRLVKDDLLSSNRGPSGGFVLKKALNTVTLYDIYRSIEGNIEDQECPVEHQVCPYNKCVFGGFGQRITSEFKEYLTNTTLESHLDSI